MKSYKEKHSRGNSICKGTEGGKSSAVSRNRNKPGVEWADVEISRSLVIHGLQILF